MTLEMLFWVSMMLGMLLVLPAAASALFSPQRQTVNIKKRKSDNKSHDAGDAVVGAHDIGYAVLVAHDVWDAVLVEHDTVEAVLGQ